jgi:hypothetical protein
MIDSDKGSRRIAEAQAGIGSLQALNEFEQV